MKDYSEYTEYNEYTKDEVSARLNEYLRHFIKEGVDIEICDHSLDLMTAWSNWFKKGFMDLKDVSVWNFEVTTTDVLHIHISSWCYVDGSSLRQVSLSSVEEYMNGS